jgi:hypothetical protein
LASTLPLLAAIASFSTARQDEDPVYEGKKASAWVDSLINDSSVRKRALAIDALAKLWVDKQYKDALPSIGRALRLDPSAAVRTQAAIALGAAISSIRSHPRKKRASAKRSWWRSAASQR